MYTVKVDKVGDVTELLAMGVFEALRTKRWTKTYLYKRLEELKEEWPESVAEINLLIKAVEKWNAPQ